MGSSNEPVAVRRFAPADADAVLDLWRRVGLGLSRTDTPEALAGKLDRDPDLFLVATENGGAIVGAVMGAFDGRRGWIYHLAVDPADQRRGIGRLLLSKLEARLRAKGCAKVNLLIQPANRDVAGFYERLGYRADELIFMEKWLDRG